MLLSIFTLTRPGNKAVNPNRNNLDIVVTTERVVCQDYVNEIAAHVTRIENEVAPKHPVFTRYDTQPKRRIQHGKKKS